MNNLTGFLALSALGVAAAAGTVSWTMIRRARRQREASSAGLIGKTCVIRSCGDNQELGRAEVPSPRGKSRVIPVRGTGDSDSVTLAAGAQALIYDYDNTGEFYLVARLAHRPHDGKSSTGPPG